MRCSCCFLCRDERGNPELIALLDLTLKTERASQPAFRLGVGVRCHAMDDAPVTKRCQQPLDVFASIFYDDGVSDAPERRKGPPQGGGRPLQSAPDPSAVLQLDDVRAYERGERTGAIAKRRGVTRQAVLRFVTRWRHLVA